MKAKRKMNSGKPDCSNRYKHDNGDSTEKQEQSKHIYFTSLSIANKVRLGPATKPVMKGLSECDKIAGNGNAAVSGRRAGTLSSSRHRNHRAYLSSCGELAMTLVERRVWNWGRMRKFYEGERRVKEIRGMDQLNEFVVVGGRNEEPEPERSKFRDAKESKGCRKQSESREYHPGDLERLLEGLLSLTPSSATLIRRNPSSVHQQARAVFCSAEFNLGTKGKIEEWNRKKAVIEIDFAGIVFWSCCDEFVLNWAIIRIALVRQHGMGGTKVSVCNQKLGNCSMGSGSEHVFVSLFWLYAIISRARIGSRFEMFVNSMSDGFEMIDDEEEYEESGKGNRFLGFMFGNVDNSGDLDVDYLDEDAKEHLSALADKLGPSLTDIDVSKSKYHYLFEFGIQNALCGGS
ncbi:hypothetical protein V8G54_015834 [Vigna mungo]|uniref:TAFII-230 TBP-binding domain-containing protein n=1 Tax=Vigna mungo TaxID=3915 RepID=A0AAQ3RX79_VIGMU